MGMFVALSSVLLLSGFCAGGPATLPPETGTCWIMGSFHYRTFDSHYYNFMGNCTYTVAKNCHVDSTHPAFEVEVKNMNRAGSQVTAVEMVSVSVYGTTVDIVHLEFGLVRVNYQLWNLPISLDNGKVKLYQSGLSVVMETDFGLTVQYDWDQHLVITVPGSFSGRMCGLCGNFNNNEEDDLTTPTGSLVSNAEALGKSWRVPGVADDAYCRDECAGVCENCTGTVIQQIENKILCKALSQEMDQSFKDCRSLVDPKVLQSNCVFDLCRGETMKTYFCNILQVSADTCQRAGVKGQNWRSPTQCPPPKCPENGHYELCGTGCPATCGNPDAPYTCKLRCVETCTCDDGFLLSGTKCVPKAQCGCTYNGRYVEAGASFWGDKSCTKRYKCSAGGGLSTQVTTSCPVGQQCQVVEGIRDCYPMTYATCMVSGDPHFVTFDGRRYNFQGTCAYQMAAVSSNQSSLEPFSVVLQSDGKDKKIGSTVTLVEVDVYGYTIVISREHTGFVMVNGELLNLPMTLDRSKLHLYTRGRFAVIETDFGVKVYYDWSSVAFVIIPGTYFGEMRGLCGNYNLNPKDDMQTRDGTQATTPEELGQSWKVGTTPGCVDGCRGPCPGCNATQRDLYTANAYCGLISDPAGPFRDCHAEVDPAGFLKDCLDDVCLYQGSGNVQCKTMTAYTAACQLKGAKVYAWRSAQFCDAQCPSHGHYELCTTGCPGSCQKLSLPSGCGAQCMEGCTCDEGFVLKGDECVPFTQCGCMYEGKYYQHGQVFYPDALCHQECTCNGTVQCEKFSCGPYEKCGVKNGVRSCQPVGKGVCSISGDPHYNTFDNSTYDFQGTCTYTAAEACGLHGTRLSPFSVVVENEKWFAMSANPKVSVAKLVAVDVYGTTLILRRNQIGMVMVNGVLSHLPLSLHSGAVKVYQEGTNDVILTDFGLRVTYDLVYHVTVTVPGNYRGKTCGLCGNFNDNTTDEFQLPNGTVTKDLVAFGAAWKVSLPGVVCEDGCIGDLCPKCDDSKKAKLEADCAVITNPSGPFAACHDVIGPASYYRDCVYDVCMAEGDHNMLCHSIAAYMLDCQDFGVKIQNWRSPSFCPLNCPANSHYETCTQSCAAPCPGLSDTVPCTTTTCAEGCTCDKGFYYNGTGCVGFDQCGCYYNGCTYKIGDSVISDDCHRIHTCHTSGVVLSQNMTCNSDESCQVKNGVMGCHLKRCILGANGTLTTFSGEAGTITDPGTYEMIQVCDQTLTSEWFRVVVKLEMCTPGVNTIMAVYVFFDNLIITMDNKRDIWINGKAMSGSVFSRENVAVTVSNNTVTINSVSSLQLSFSLQSLTMSVSDNVAEQVCGACGRLSSTADTRRPTLRERLRVSLKGQTLASLNMGKWKAPDFPQW
ncbi:IgGFc-binding protein-like [Diretmus argenteus]